MYDKQIDIISKSMADSNAAFRECHDVMAIRYSRAKELRGKIKTLYKTAKTFEESIVERIVSVSDKFKGIDKEDKLPLVKWSKEMEAWRELPVGILKRSGIHAATIKKLKDFETVGELYAALTGEEGEDGDVKELPAALAEFKAALTSSITVLIEDHVDKVRETAEEADGEREYKVNPDYASLLVENIDGLHSGTVGTLHTLDIKNMGELADWMDDNSLADLKKHLVAKEDAEIIQAALEASCR